ncbi:MAG: hypothetical protein DRJ52_06095 [Thermoprotei archaeon]|nr:MAG: hypothetical protein DRJ52_06095 [Thermoprotei archaeon]RLF00657.1 MAG: hypothetical protein DRJ63_01835 [Thermoprotei archaeon]
MRIKLSLIILAVLVLIIPFAQAQPFISTPSKTPLAGAKVKVTYVTGESFEATLDSEGRLVLTNVPLGKVNVTILEWKGVPIGVTYLVTYKNPVIVCKEIGKLEVKVVGARGQEIKGATVAILYENKVIETGTTDTAGTYMTELPQAKYKVKATYGGKTAEGEVEVVGSETAKITLQLDIFVTLAGWSMTLPEFIGLIILVIVVIIALVIIAYEYSIWRRKKLAKALVTPSTR